MHYWTTQEFTCLIWLYAIPLYSLKFWRINAWYNEEMKRQARTRESKVHLVCTPNVNDSFLKPSNKRAKRCRAQGIRVSYFASLIFKKTHKSDLRYSNIGLQVLRQKDMTINQEAHRSSHYLVCWYPLLLPLTLSSLHIARITFMTLYHSILASRKRRWKTKPGQRLDKATNRGRVRCW